jgi:tRNA G18 (ribose-2'-O)-methylase SpoU
VSGIDSAPNIDPTTAVDPATSIETVAIVDPHDPRIASFRGLRDHALRRQRESPGGDMSGWFVVEGDGVCLRAIEAGYKVVSVLIDATRTERLDPALIAANPVVYAAGIAVVKDITGFAVHRGMLGLFERRTERTPADVVSGARLLVALIGVVNPTNVGLIARSAAGLGADGMLLNQACCDPLYRRASRVAMGEVFKLPWARFGSLADLHDLGVDTWALSPRGEPLDSAPLGNRPIALVVGPEGPGLGADDMAAATARVGIAMHRGVDSLNVGIATAVAINMVASRLTSRHCA